jgi:integrase
MVEIVVDIKVCFRNIVKQFAHLFGTLNQIDIEFLWVAKRDNCIASGVQVRKAGELALSDLPKALKSGRLDGTGGLAPKTVRNIHGVIHASLSQAVRWQMIAVNAAAAVDPPKVSRREVTTASEGQIRNLIDVVNLSPYRMPVLVVVCTGMRRGEALGLKWEDFDEERRTLCVRRSISQVVGRVFPKEPKSGRSRVVVMPETLVRELVQHRQQQALNKTLLGEDYKDDGWICASGDGSLITPNALGKGFMRLARAAQVKTTLHGLRHAQATQLIMAGVPAKVVSERLGHANTGITQDLYTHVLPHSQQQAADVMERLIAKPKETDEP